MTEKELPLNLIPQHLHVYIVVPHVGGIQFSGSTDAEVNGVVFADEKADMGGGVPGAFCTGSAGQVVPQGTYVLLGEGAPLLTAEHREFLARMASVMTGAAVRV